MAQWKRQAPGVQLEERWLAEWIAYGLAELAAYLEKHAQFDQYLKENDDHSARPTKPNPKKKASPP